MDNYKDSLPNDIDKLKAECDSWNVMAGLHLRLLDMQKTHIEVILKALADMLRLSDAIDQHKAVTLKWYHPAVQAAKARLDCLKPLLDFYTTQVSVPLQSETTPAQPPVSE